MPLELVAEGLGIVRGGRLLLADLSFRVASGQALLLTGPNGAGKTTLIRTIAGFARPAAGTIRLAGGPEEAETGESCHYIGHANAVKPVLTVAENATFWARYLGGTQAPVAAALERFALTELAHVPAGYLSAGQKRRLALSRLMLAPRPVWLLDEPTVSLDTASTGILAAAIAEHLAGGGITLAATHIPLGLGQARELRLGERLLEA